MEKPGAVQLSKDRNLLSFDAQRALLGQLPQWRIDEFDGIRRLVRSFHFKDFARAMEFANLIGELAEASNHHPALLVEWGKTTVSWWTHSLGGLHQNDFILAARCDSLYSD